MQVWMFAGWADFAQEMAQGEAIRTAERSDRPARKIQLDLKRSQ